MADPAAADLMQMNLDGVERGAHDPEGYEPLALLTSRGRIDARYYAAPGATGTARATGGAIFVGGAGGGFDTPVRGWLYPRLSEQLSRDDGLAALRVAYRCANHLDQCALDVLAAVAFLGSEGVRRVGLVGHSFGGAVVIQAAAADEAVRTCVPMSTQTYGVDPAGRLGPRCSLLLTHGQADEILPPDCSRYVYEIAREPKKLLLHPTAGHGLDEWADELPDILRAWLTAELRRDDDHRA